MNVILGLPELVIELRKLSLQLKNSNQAYSLGKADAFSGCADSIEARLAAQAQAIERACQMAIEEHEAALCPEDYGCKEYIAFLRKKVAEIEQAKLEVRLDEAVYMRSMAGDHVMGLCDGTCLYCLHIAELRAALAALRSASEPRAVQDSKP